MFLYLYIALQMHAIILFTAAIVQQKYRHRRSAFRTRLCESYIRQIVKMIFSEECCDIYPAPDNATNRWALAEAIYTTMSHTYGTDTIVVRELLRRYRLDTFLQQRIKWSSDPRKAHILMLMSAIPSDTASTQILRRYFHSSNRHIRISALLATLAADPSRAITTISAVDFKLSPLDIARIIGLLRRGLLPIAYEPLLLSSNRNLQMLGLSIVRNFGIEIADKQLQNMIATATDADVVHEAIYTLSSLGHSLGRTKVRERLSTMTPRRRKQLCRHLTQAGYSLAALQCLFSPSETRHSESIIKSYKRNIVCQQSSTIS